jgi:hypothetical protein
MKEPPREAINISTTAAAAAATGRNSRTFFCPNGGQVLLLW